VEKARLKQSERYKRIKIHTNSQLGSRHFEKHCPLTDDARQLLRRSFQSFNLSMRAHDRIIKVARTIADLDGKEVIDSAHIAEAVQYRSLDRH
jgi:magnesium chelatase family protein